MAVGDNMLEMVGNIWENLTEMAEKEPGKYQELIEQSKNHHKMASTSPVPNTCFTVLDKVRIISFECHDFCNNFILWMRICVAFERNGSLVCSIDMKVTMF